MIYILAMYQFLQMLHCCRKRLVYLMLEKIKEEIINSDISAHDLRIVLDIINKYEKELKDKISS